MNKKKSRQIVKCKIFFVTLLLISMSMGVVANNYQNTTSSSSVPKQSEISVQQDYQFSLDIGSASEELFLIMENENNTDNWGFDSEMGYTNAQKLIDFSDKYYRIVSNDPVTTQMAKSKSQYLLILKNWKNVGYYGKLAAQAAINGDDSKHIEYLGKVIYYLDLLGTQHSIFQVDLQALLDSPYGQNTVIIPLSTPTNTPQSAKKTFYNYWFLNYESTENDAYNIKAYYLKGMTYDDQKFIQDFVEFLYELNKIEILIHVDLIMQNDNALIKHKQAFKNIIELNKREILNARVSSLYLKPKELAIELLENTEFELKAIDEANYDAYAFYYAKNEKIVENLNDYITTTYTSLQSENTPLPLSNSDFELVKAECPPFAYLGTFLDVHYTLHYKGDSAKYVWVKFYLVDSPNTDFDKKTPIYYYSYDFEPGESFGRPFSPPIPPMSAGNYYLAVLISPVGTKNVGNSDQIVILFPTQIRICGSTNELNSYSSSQAIATPTPRVISTPAKTPTKSPTRTIRPTLISKDKTAIKSYSDLYFSLDYPQNWTWKDGSQNNIYTITFFPIDSVDMQYLLVSFIQLPAVPTKDQRDILYENYLNGLGKTFKKFNLIEAYYTEFKSFPAKKFVYTYYENQVKIKGELTITFVDDSVYAFDFITPEPFFDKNYFNLSTLLNSIKIKK